MDVGLALKSVSNVFPMRMSSHAPGPIGIDFGTERINLVQVARADQSCIVRAATSLPYSTDRAELLQSGSELKRLVRHALGERPFRGRKAVASVPPSMVDMLVINYRCESAADEVAAIVRATEERIGDSINSRVVDYLPISGASDDHDRSALVAVAKHDAILGYLDALRSCALDVVALEVGPVAIQRLIGEIDDNHDATVVAITFGTVKSYVTVLAAGELLIDREIEFGTRSIVDKLVDTLDCDANEALDLIERHGLALNQAPMAVNATDTGAFAMTNALTEIVKPQFLALASDIVRVRDYAVSETRAGSGATRIYAFGSLARWPNADRLLSQLCNIEIASINPFYGLDVGNKAVAVGDIGPICGVAVATGLALRGSR